MARKNLEWWKEKLNRSSFFFIALFLHVVVLAMVATLVIFQPNILSTPDFAKVYIPQGAPPPPPPPTTPVTVSVPTASAPVVAPPIVSLNTAAPFMIPTPDVNMMDDVKMQPQIKPSTIVVPPHDNLATRLPSIRETEAKWGRSEDNIRKSDDDVHNLVAKFPIYLAQYADGDWGCNNYQDNSATPADGTGTITGGCLPNMIYQIGLWSHGKVKGAELKVIAVDSPDLLTYMPPFIFFTGHRDFHLTDSEIENLQKYLQAGGAIWGDSAFAGDGSRFDVAFHREMKRVLPDVDKNFVDLPLTHDIFTKSWYPISQVPTGMNYRADPVQIINLDGKLAVIYTPNDYSDMMTMVLLAGADPPQIDPNSRSPWAPTKKYPLFTPGNWVNSSTIFYRNYEPDSAQDCYKLSINILTHLLIRFDSDLNMAP